MGVRRLQWAAKDSWEVSYDFASQYNSF